MGNNIETYLQTHKEVNINFDIHILDLALRDVRLEQGYFPGEAIAKALCMSFTTLPDEIEQFFLYKMNRDVRSLQNYYFGFTDTAFLIQNAFSVFIEGYQAGMTMLSWYPDFNESFLYLANRYLLNAVTMLENDRSAITFVNSVVAQELSSAHAPFFYSVGMVALQNVYQQYMSALEVILPSSQYNDSESKDEVTTIDILPSLINNRKKTTVPLPNFNSLTKTKVETDDFDDKYSKKFLEQLNLIRQLQSKRGSSIQDLIQELDKWKQILSINSIKEHTAVYSTICLTSSNIAYDIYHENSEKKYLYDAIGLLTKSLNINSVWESELGTRRINSFKLGTLLCENIDNLDNSSADMANLIKETYKDCLQTNERLFQRSQYWESKERLQARIDLVIARIIEVEYFLSTTGSKDASLNALEIPIFSEALKSRFIRLEMSLSEIKPPDSITRELIDNESMLLSQLRNILRELLSRKWDEMIKEHVDQKDKEIRELYLDLESVWAKMELHSGDDVKSYASFRRDDILSIDINQEWHDIVDMLLSLGPKSAVISLRRLPESVMFSVMKSNLEKPVNLVVPLSRNLFYEYVYSYDKEIRNRNVQYYKIEDTRKWQELGEILFAPVEPFINDCDLVYFLPHTSFHQIPLHSLKLHGEPLITRWKVVYAPSMNVLKATLNHSQATGKSIVLGYYENDDSEILQKSILDEVTWVADYLDTGKYIGSEARSSAIYEQAEKAKVIHLACHGYYNPEDPLDSGVILRSGPFTARDWLKLRLQSELVVLSTCGSGINTVGGGDNLVGLMRSILFAGSASLLLALWDVDSISSAKWMKTFYKNIWNTEGTKIGLKADAFQKASLELMGEDDDPYYWSPFILTGDYS